MVKGETGTLSLNIRASVDKGVILMSQSVDRRVCLLNVPINCSISDKMILCATEKAAVPHQRIFLHQHWRHAFQVNAQCFVHQSSRALSDSLFFRLFTRSTVTSSLAEFSVKLVSQLWKHVGSSCTLFMHPDVMFGQGKRRKTYNISHNLHNIKFRSSHAEC